MKRRQQQPARTHAPRQQAPKAPTQAPSPLFSGGDADFMDIDLEHAASMGNEALLDAITRQSARAAAPPPDDGPGDTEGSARAPQRRALPFRTEMEQAYGQSFGHVQVFTGDDVEEAGEALGAEAFTIGDEIAFGNATPSKELVAHELAHVAQVEGSGAAARQNAPASRRGQAAEREADQASSVVAGGGRYQVQEQPGGAVQGSWLSAISDAIDSVGDTVSSTVSNVVEAVTGGDEQSSAQASSAPVAEEEESSWFSDTFGGAVEAVHTTVSTVGDALGSATSTVVDVLGLDMGENWAEWTRPSTTTYGQEYEQEEDAPTVLYASGVNTDAETAAEGAEALAELLGVPVTSIANPTSGLYHDLIECAAEKFFGIDSVPSQTIADQIVENLLNEDGVMIYAHSQGSINTASAIRQAEDALTLYYEQQGVDDPRTLAQQTISENVSVQPIGGAANYGDQSMDVGLADIDNPWDVITEYAQDVWSITGGALEAAFGDYPNWYTGLETPLADAGDLVPTALTRDVELEDGYSFWSQLGSLETHGIDSYIENHGDTLQSSYDHAQAAMSVSSSATQLLADASKDTPEREQAIDAMYASLASGDSDMMALMHAILEEPKGTGILFLEAFAASDLEPFIEPFDATSTALGYVPYAPAQTMSTGLGVLADGMTTFVGLVRGDDGKVLDGATGLGVTAATAYLPDVVEMDLQSLDAWLDNAILQSAINMVEGAAQEIVDEVTGT